MILILCIFKHIFKVEMNASKSAVGAQSLCNAMQVMKDKLSHLYLAHNRLAGIPQLVNVLSVSSLETKPQLLYIYLIILLLSPSRRIVLI